MAWLQSIDTALFRFVNQTLSNPCFDWLMPMLSGFALFIPALILLGVLFVWKGGARARLCVFFLLLVTALGDGVICRTLKQATARPRPCLTLPGVRLPMTFRADRAATAPPAAAKPAEPGRRMRGCSLSGSMPSAHAANCFAAATVAFIFFRRTARLLYPLAAAVAFSRVYNGVHYPSDVLAGAVLGAGYAFAFVWATNSLWRWAGQKWLPLWWDKLPSLALTPHAPRSTPHASSPDQHWLRLGYVLIALIFFAKLAYLAGGVIELSEDEAYQWLWSKHPALSYFSKPPLIAWTQWLGTQLWGDTELGVRFFSPVIAATLGILLLRFFAREVNVRAGLALVLIINVTPLLAVGGTLLTVDPLLILFWTAALLAGWRAVQPGGTTCHWLWTGLWMGLAFLAKYSALYQWLCWAVFFALWPPARAHLRRPGPWLALVINLLCMLPVLVWNQQHDWITLAHVASNGKLNSAWHPQWKFPAEFLGLTIGLLHPVFFVAAAWAAITFWRRDRRAAQLDTTERRSPIRRGGDANLEPAGSETGAPARRRALLLFFFCMGAPVYLFHLLYTIHSRVFPNWIAPAVLPLFCLMVVYWEQRWREGARGPHLAGGRRGFRPRRGGAFARHRSHPKNHPAPTSCAGRAAAPGARLEGSGRHRRDAAAKAARGRSAGFHHRRPLRHHQRAFVLSARSEGGGARRATRLFSHHRPSAKPVLLLARLSRITARAERPFRVEEPRNQKAADGVGQGICRSARPGTVSRAA